LTPPDVGDEKGLPRLPEEVLRIIFRMAISAQVQDHHHRPDKAKAVGAKMAYNMVRGARLYKLELVCKEWHQVALSLYKDLCIGILRERPEAASPLFSWHQGS